GSAGHVARGRATRGRRRQGSQLRPDPCPPPGAGPIRLACPRDVSRRLAEGRGLGSRGDDDGDDRTRRRRQAGLRRRGRLSLLPVLGWIPDSTVYALPGVGAACRGTFWIRNRRRGGVDDRG